MNKPQVNRRLAAILAADVVGYSRLMDTDEPGTATRLKSYRSEVIDPLIARGHGRIFKTTGDGLLAEFASVVDAVESAAEFQRLIARRNAELMPEKRMLLRVGINLGDVMAKGTIFSATGSTSPRASKPSPSRAGC